MRGLYWVSAVILFLGAWDELARVLRRWDVHYARNELVAYRRIQWGTYGGVRFFVLMLPSYEWGRNWCSVAREGWLQRSLRYYEGRWSIALIPVPVDGQEPYRGY